METRSSDSQPPTSTSVTAGASWIVLARFGFLFGSYGLYFLLERVGGKALFEEYKAVVAWVSVAATVVRQGATQMVARFTAACPWAVAAVRARSLRLLVVVGTLVGVALLLVARSQEAGGGGALALAALIVLAYAVGAVWHGTLNGSGRLVTQGRLDLTFSGLKLTGVVLGAVLFGTTTAAVGGFLAAATLTAIIGALVVGQAEGPDPARPGPRTAELGRFLLSTVGFMFALQWTVQLDLWYLRWWVPGVTLDDRSAYAGFQLFSQIPYALVAAIVFLAFPGIARGGSSVAEGGRRLGGALRATFVSAGLVLAGVQAQPEAALGLLFPDDAVQLLGEGRRLAFGLVGLAYFALCVLFVAGSCLTAFARPRAAAVASGCAAGVQAIVAFALAQSHGVVGIAAGTLAGHLGGAVVAIVFARREMHLCVPWATLGRVALGVLAILLIGTFWQGGGLLAVGARSIVMTVVYLLVVFGLGERWPVRRGAGA